MMVTVTLDLPTDSDADSPEELTRRLRLLWTLDEVGKGRLTRARACHLLGLGLDEFLQSASEHGLDAIDYNLEDFRLELAVDAADHAKATERKNAAAPSKSTDNASGNTG